MAARGRHTPPRSDADDEVPWAVRLVPCHCPTIRAFVSRAPSAAEARAYGAALEHALLVLPKALVDATDGLPANTTDDAAGKGGCWFGRAPELINQLMGAQRPSPSLAELLDAYAGAQWASASFEGWVLYAHGSGGLGGASVRICRALADQGYVVIAPDTYAGGRVRRMAPVREDPAAALPSSPPLLPHSASTGLYPHGSEAVGRLVYSSDADAVRRAPERYRAMYEEVAKLRASELGHALRTLPECVRAGSAPLHLAGHSEGAMALARLPHDACVPPVRVASLAITGWPLERNYFHACACARLAVPATPTLAVMGSEDQFFGGHGSVAAALRGALVDAALAGDEGAERAVELTGSPHRALVEAAVPAGFAAVLAGSAHDITAKHFAVVRELHRAFLAAPADAPRLCEGDGLLAKRALPGTLGAHEAAGARASWAHFGSDVES